MAEMLYNDLLSVGHPWRTIVDLSSKIYTVYECFL
jgi:hypothetical protein